MAALMTACRRLAVTIVLLTSLPLVAATSAAGQFNRVLSIGAEAPAWTSLEGVDGKRHDYAEVATAKFVVVAFTCNSCPYAVDVESKLIALAKKAVALSGTLVAINVNTIEADALPAMRQKAKDKGFEFAYLYDPSQEIANRFGAKTTPEFYVLGPDRKVVYMGSLDDSSDVKPVTKAYVESAIEAVLTASVPEIAETIPIGCRIRFTRVRGKD